MCFANHFAFSLIYSCTTRQTASYLFIMLYLVMIKSQVSHLQLCFLGSQPETLALIQSLLDIQNIATAVPTNGFCQMTTATTNNTTSTTVASSPPTITSASGSSFSNLQLLQHNKQQTQKTLQFYIHQLSFQRCKKAITPYFRTQYILQAHTHMQLHLQSFLFDNKLSLVLGKYQCTEIIYRHR